MPNSGAVHMSSAGVAGELLCMLALADLPQRSVPLSQSASSVSPSQLSLLTL